MSRKIPRISTNSVPGKVFLLGEYAVLAGAPALVAAIPPRYELAIEAGSGAVSPFHPESPAGLLLKSWDVKLDGRRIEFRDPHHGEGGFGGSTAEFALLLRSLGVDDAFDAHREYRKLVDRGQKFPPSGADLIAQWKGGVHEIVAGESTRDVTRAVSEFSWLFFSASHLHGRKVRTHEHLKQLESRTHTDFSRLRGSIDLGLRAIDEVDAVHLGQALTAFADGLGEMGLEDPDAHGDRMSVMELPGVLGAKGCGAMLADSFVVLCESNGVGEEVVDCLEGRGLKLVQRGIRPEAGMRSEDGT